MNKDYCTRREEELKERFSKLIIVYGLVSILLLFVMIFGSIKIENLEEQNQIIYDSTENCQCVCPQKEVFYIEIDDLNKTNPTTYIRNELGEFVKE